ncbi:hypothetical protein JHK82_043361 [Glycine max]|nr:hypothetical protein JHK82_043361 [Glycine max]
MLHRSFKPAKCKTALKLAVSRIKLLKNKREAQIKQLKRELAQLLESGQDRTARIRVEHVVREEKTMAAYDLVEIYCELIAARLPMIESQKNCPIDLKEAVSSVIFASPRCSDIPELVDVKKQITSKYGKEFVSAAIELRLTALVEKLSAKAPDGPTKIKILAAIAEEHNIKWEPKSFGENDVKSSQDFLVGPSTSEKAAYAEPSQIHVPPAHDEKGPSNLHASSQVKPVHHASTNSYEQSASGAARKDQSTTSGVIGTWDSRMLPLLRRQLQNLPERASMAARAAAELSNRENMTRQYSSGSHSSSGSSPVDTSFHRSSSGMHNEQITAAEQDNLVGPPYEYYRNSHENVVRHAQSASLMSDSAFRDDKPFIDGNQMADIYQHNNSFGQKSSDLHEMGIKTQAGRSEEDFVTDLYDDSDLNAENSYHFGDARTNRQSSKVSSSHFITPTDDHNDNLDLDDWNTRNKAGRPFFSSEKEDLPPVTFDDSDDPGSDSDMSFVNKSKVSGLSGYGASGSSSRNDKNVGSDRKSWLSPLSVDSDTVEEHFERRVDTTTVSEKNLGYDDLPASQSPTKERSSILGLDIEANNDIETLKEYRIECGKELSYGTLKGGFRNKGFKRPPYINNTLDDSSSSLGDASVQNERSLPIVRTSIGSDAPVQDKYTREVSRGNRTMGLGAHNIPSDSDSYRVVANSQETLARTNEPHIQKEQKELTKQNSPSLARPVSGISRRTSASSKAATGLYESNNQNASTIMKSSENRTGPKSGSAKNKASEPISEPNRSLDGEISKSSARVQPSSSLKTVIQDNEEGQEDDADTSSKQKVGHVHPKLPDYDSFAAHFLSLKKGRQ